MCCGAKKVKNHQVQNIYSADGEITAEKQNEHCLNLPEHVDDPYLNRNVRTGILGFRYETKNSSIVVYSSVEAKTFCMLMRLELLRCVVDS